MSKKWLLLVVLVLVAGLVIAGCGKPKVESGPVTPPTPAAGKSGAAPAVTPPAGAENPKPADLGAPAGATGAIPAPTATAPVAPAVAGSPWAQIKAARAGVTSYKATMQQGAQKATQYIKMVNGKPSRMRIEAGPNWVLVQLDKKKAYIYNPQMNVAMVAPTDKGELAKAGEIDDTKMIEKEAKKVTSGALDGMDCWVVEVGGKNPATVWIDKKQGLLRQIQEKDKTIKMKVEDVNGVENKIFELPAGTKTKDMAEVMKGMQGGMPMPPK